MSLKYSMNKVYLGKINKIIKPYFELESVRYETRTTRDPNKPNRGFSPGWFITIKGINGMYQGDFENILEQLKWEMKESPEFKTKIKFYLRNNTIKELLK
jgi:hypothetical protein